MGEQGAFSSEFREEPLLALLLRPLTVRPNFKVCGDGIKYIGVAIRLLADVKSHKGEAEGGHLAKEVKEATLSNCSVATCTEGAIAKL